MIIDFEIEIEGFEQKVLAQVSEYFVEDYGEGWFGIKRLDFESQTHAIPEGDLSEWLELMLSFQQQQEYHSKRLALKYSENHLFHVILYSPRNASYMSGPPERDYLAMTVETFKKLVKEITDNIP